MIRLDNINKYFFKGKKNQIHVIDNTSLELPEKGLVTILGPSGSGKTTLLNVIGGLDTFDSGTLTIDNLKLNKNSYRRIESIRNTDIGYVFQDYKLIDDYTVFENVALSLNMCGIKDKSEVNNRVNEILTHLGIYRYRNRKAAMLSGGERQRVSIARALVKDPRIVICDEPTGNLDSKRTVEIMNIIKAISKNRLVLLVSHEDNIAKFYSDRIIEIKDGKITADYVNEVGDSLDYEIANKIYLKDIKNHYSLKKKGIELNVYDNDEEDIKINLVIRNNSIYIETEDVNNVELINKDSAFEFIDEHYKAINKKELEDQEFKIAEIKNKKRTSIYNVFSMIKAGWHNLINSKRIERLTLLFAGISVALVLCSISLYLGAKEIHEEDYLYMDTAYLEVRKDEADVNDLYKELSLRDDVVDIQNWTHSINAKIPAAYYYQASEIDDFAYSLSLSSLDLLTKDDILYGRYPEKPNEVVMDESFYNEDNTRSYLRVSGIVSVTDLLGKKIVNQLSGREYTIVGVVDKKNHSFYMNNEEIETLALIEKENTYLSYINSYEENMDNIEIVEGNAPTNFMEVLVPDYLMASTVIGSKYKQTTGFDKTFEYTISGYYKTNYDFNPNQESRSNIYISRDTMRYTQLNLSRTLYVAVKDKDAFIKEYGDKYRVVDLEDEAFKEYDLIRKERVINTMLSAVVFFIITLVFVVLMTRASFLSRIKEVGVYRAVGVSKNDLYRMFAGESIVIIGIGGFVGLVLGYYILRVLRDARVFDFGVVLNPYMAIIVYILMIIFYLFAVILPVIFILRKSPAAILSRKDV